MHAFALRWGLSVLQCWLSARTRFAWARYAWSFRGNTTVNVVPCSFVLVAEMVPLCETTMLFAIAKPKPNLPFHWRDCAHGRFGKIYQKCAQALLCL